MPQVVVCVMVKLPSVTATQLLLLPGTSAQVPMMEPPLRIKLLLGFTVPVTDVPVSVMASPADEVMVNENVPVTWSSELNVTNNFPVGSLVMVDDPKQVPEFRN